ncbi:MAG: Zn-ribbon domain-containing OB-fold protein [Alphaproteobacteria bacterium]
MADIPAGALPAVPWLVLPQEGEPYLEGHQCGNCGAIFLGQRSVCSKCTARDQMTPVKLPNRGTLYSYTIVHRSYPGVEVPFVSAVVDLENGASVKGNLIEIEPKPENIEMGMPVEIVYRDAGRTDGEGNKYAAYFFRPAGS